MGFDRSHPGPMTSKRKANWRQWPSAAARTSARRSAAIAKTEALSQTKDFFCERLYGVASYGVCVVYAPLQDFIVLTFQTIRVQDFTGA
jgi:hypothetical protein